MSKVWSHVKDFFVFGLYFTGWSIIAVALGGVFVKVTGIGSKVRGFFVKS